MASHMSQHVEHIIDRLHPKTTKRLCHMSGLTAMATHLYEINTWSLLIYVASHKWSWIHALYKKLCIMPTKTQLIALWVWGIQRDDCWSHNPKFNEHRLKSAQCVQRLPKETPQSHLCLSTLTHVHIWEGDIASWSKLWWFLTSFALIFKLSSQRSEAQIWTVAIFISECELDF